MACASPQQLTGKHSPCPCCGEGRDRFRFDNLEGRGTWICNQCGAGDGVALVRPAKNLDFRAAADLVRSALPGAAVTDPPTRKPSDPRAHLERWRKATQLNGSEPDDEWGFPQAAFYKVPERIITAYELFGVGKQHPARPPRRMTTEEWERHAVWTMDYQRRRIEDQNAEWGPPENEAALLAAYRAGPGEYFDV